MTIRFLDPTQAAEVLPVTLATGALTGRQLAVGLLSNNKPNADRLLRIVADRLADTLSVKQIVEVAKGSSSTNAPQELLERLAVDVDFALVAIGD